MTFTTVIYDKSDGIAWITLNRPAALNAYNIAMRDELFEVLSALREDDEVRVAVFKGAGRAFCAGADLTEFGTAPSPTRARSIRFARDVWAELLMLAVPTIAALHGFVFGSGLEVALFCDLRIAAEGTMLGLPEVQLGMIPAAGGTQSAARACGLGNALNLLLTARRIDAAEALRIGLITRMVAPERLQSEVESIAARIAALDRHALTAVRRAVREGADLSLDQALELDERLAAGVRADQHLASGD
jgi:enoyl-CoA hydratase/carnithine racemase